MSGWLTGSLFLVLNNKYKLLILGGIAILAVGAGLPFYTVEVDQSGIIQRPYNFWLNTAVIDPTFSNAVNEVAQSAGGVTQGQLTAATNTTWIESLAYFQPIGSYATLAQLSTVTNTMWPLFDIAGSGTTAANQATNKLGTAAWQNIGAFDASGAGTTAANQATNTLWAKALAYFDISGAGTTAANQATNTLWADALTLFSTGSGSGNYQTNLPLPFSFNNWFVETNSAGGINFSNNLYGLSPLTINSNGSLSMPDLPYQPASGILSLNGSTVGAMTNTYSGLYTTNYGAPVGWVFTTNSVAPWPVSVWFNEGTYGLVTNGPGIASTITLIGDNSSGQPVYLNTNTFDTSGAGTSAANQSTNTLWVQALSYFDISGAGTTAANQATNTIFTSSSSSVTNFSPWLGGVLALSNLTTNNPTTSGSPSTNAYLFGRDRAFFLGFWLSAATAATFSNLYVVKLTQAVSTNAVIASWCQANYGPWTNNSDGAGGRFILLCTSNTITILTSSVAPAVSSTYGMDFHVDQP
jgi:hypothetical protein